MDIYRPRLANIGRTYQCLWRFLSKKTIESFNRFRFVLGLFLVANRIGLFLVAHDENRNLAPWVAFALCGDAYPGLLSPS